MKANIYGAIMALFFITATKAQENDWIAYKDELYIKSFPNLETYEGAKEFCSSLGDQVSKASLVMVKEPDLQDLLTNYTQDIYDNIWLGGTYDEDSSQFKWDDGEPLTYTHWQEGFPRNVTEEDVCIELRPHDARRSNKIEGKWANVSCRKRNLVLCQKRIPWTLEDAVSEIIKNRKQIEEGKKNMEEMSSRVVPVGSIYIEYSGQPSPPTLWPSLTWQDITITYAGLFFRAYGDGSDQWGISQAECAPRISQMNFAAIFGGSDPEPPNPISIPSQGWSEYGFAGEIYAGEGNKYYELLRFHTDSCEVRPKNQAIRIWKRIA